MIQYGLLLITSLMVCLLVMPMAISFGKRFSMVDRPGERKVHRHPMPRSGGIAIASGVFFGLSAFAFSDTTVQAVLLGALVIFLIGVIDDKWNISPKYKFAGEVLAAIAFVWWSGVHLHSLGNLFGLGPIETGKLADIVTVIGIVGVTNAMNLSDGLDGLAGGMGAIACLFFAFFAYISGQWNVLSIDVVLFGALLGFLYYNSHPAKVFMGDAGSLLLGYILATIAVLLAEGQNHSVAPISMALILALPIIDTLMVMTRRMLQGRSPFSPDKSHLHHRLLHLGLPHGMVVSVLYGVMGIFGLIAVYLRHASDWIQLVAGGGVAFLVYGAVWALERLGFQWVNAGKAAGASGQDTLFYLMTRWSGRSIPWVTWLIPCALLVPVFFLPPLPDSLNILLVLSAIGILLVYPIRTPDDRLGLVHGLLYWSVFLLLSVFSYFGNNMMRVYLGLIAVLVTVWVIIKLVFKRAHRAFLTSPLEILLILISLVVPESLSEISYFDEITRERLMVACLESVPFLLAMKIIIRRQPRRNRGLMLSMLTILLLAVLKGLIV